MKNLKLKLKKTVVSKLTNDQQSSIKGGSAIAACQTTGHTADTDPYSQRDMCSGSCAVSCMYGCIAE